MMIVQRLPQVIGSVRVYHHWHAPSERYTGGDSLATLIDEGWSVGEIVRLEEHWRAGVRRVVVYHFELTRAGDVQFVPVIRNPYVDRLICLFGLHVIPMARRIEPMHEAKIEPAHEAKTVRPVSQTVPEPAVVRS